MRYELTRIDPLRAANISAMVYGLMMGVFALLILPFFVLMGLFAASRAQGPEALGPLIGIFALLVYPVMGAVMGWISGILGAAIYNLVIRWSGGLLLELSGPDPAG